MYCDCGDEFRIKTKLGDLVVHVGNDPDYPEFYICLETENEEFTLACIGEEGNVIRTRIKEEIPCQDFTMHVDFSEETIQRACDELENEGWGDK